MLFFLFFGIFADFLSDRVGAEISLAGTRSHTDTKTTLAHEDALALWNTHEHSASEKLGLSVSIVH